MGKMKCLLIAMAIMVCDTAFAQFSNANHGRGKTHGSSIFDGKGPKSGYKGFVETGYTIGVGDAGDGRISAMTVHGYQINPYIFAGIGAGGNYFHKAEKWNVPIFADVRSNILDHSISPFVDVKIGYSILDVEGFFFSPSIGCRFAIGEKSGLNVSVGYELQKFKIEQSYSVYGYSGSVSAKGTCGGVAFKVGLDF